MKTKRNAIRAELPGQVFGKEAAAKRTLDKLADVGVLRTERCTACWHDGGGRVEGMGGDFECEVCRGTGWVSA